MRDLIFCGNEAKERTGRTKGEFGYGDVYPWTVIDADTKFIPCWYVRTRDAESAYAFIHDLASRLIAAFK